MRILVTGSDNLLRITHSTHLAGDGFNVVEAQTYRDAQIILRAGMLPDLILINLKAVDASARAFVEWVRDEFSYLQVQIVVLGGDSSVGADISLPRLIETHALTTVLHLAAYTPA
jgi:DNA-binding response OmpR family regulator